MLFCNPLYPSKHMGEYCAVWWIWVMALRTNVNTSCCSRTQCDKIFPSFFFPCASLSVLTAGIFTNNYAHSHKYTYTCVCESSLTIPILFFPGWQRGWDVSRRRILQGRTGELFSPWLFSRVPSKDVLDKSERRVFWGEFRLAREWFCVRQVKGKGQFVVISPRRWVLVVVVWQAAGCCCCWPPRKQVSLWRWGPEHGEKRGVGNGGCCAVWGLPWHWQITVLSSDKQRLKLEVHISRWGWKTKHLII